MTEQREAGFTLTEALVALLVISLGMAGLLQSNRIIAHFNKQALLHTYEAKSLKAFEDLMRSRLTPIQPIKSGSLEGDGLQMRFSCSVGADSKDCTLNAPQGHFVYAADGVAYAAWPPMSKEPRLSFQRLEAVMLKDKEGRTLALVTLPVEQGLDCQFDMISRECYEEAYSHE